MGATMAGRNEVQDARASEAPVMETGASDAVLPNIRVCILARNEERRIATCLSSLPLDDPRMDFHVVVNGSHDHTALFARMHGGGRVTVHDWPEGGKARSWNRFVFDLGLAPARAWVFVDGDAEVLAGSIDALVSALNRTSDVNAASALPWNGRRSSFYQSEIIRTSGLFGDLYALSGDFVERMRGRDIRLPEDLISDDGLLATLAKTNLVDHGSWQDRRVVACTEAGFICEPVRWASWAGWKMQFRRMVNYAERRFQDQIIQSFITADGPLRLPRELSPLYHEWVGRFEPRNTLPWWLFDRLAMRRIKRRSVVHRADAASGGRPAGQVRDCI
jgi:hypothetical protein